MNNINSKSLFTKRLDLRIPSNEEQYRLWQILCLEEVNQYYFPTPNRIFKNNDLSKTNIVDLQEARRLFLKDFTNWEIQKPFYEEKIKRINSQIDGSKFTWSIFLRRTDVVIGQITCQDNDKNNEDIRDVGWYIDPKYQGNGFAYEAANSILDFMFNEVNIKEIKTSAASINEASWKLMEKLGFKYTGDSLSTYFKNDEILTSKEYYLDKELYLNNPKRKTLTYFNKRF